MAIAFNIEEEFSSGAGQLISVLSDVAAWSVSDQPRLISAKNGEVTLAFDDDTRAKISVEIMGDGVRAKILHELLKNESEIKPRQHYWNEVLMGMHRRLDQK
jgi:hypothetical protein